MYVVATAGHVDHGKSTLVRALTGIEPDRLAEEKRRGLTIDLGFAWTTLPSGADVAFVDVPGHERFIGNMLAGVGPAPVVMFVVAADDGWRSQSSEHRDALAALGIDRGVVVISRADRADRHRIEATRAQVRDELAGTGLGGSPIVVVSAVGRLGMTELSNALDGVLRSTPEPDRTERVRMWVDRSFVIAGAGTVVTGTLAAGCVRVGDTLALSGTSAVETVSVRGIQTEESEVDEIGPVSRVALNLRGVGVGDVVRGDVLLTPDTWPVTAIADVRRVTGPAFGDSPVHLTAHAGTAAIAARVRPLDADHARLQLDRPLPLIRGDRIVLRDPGNAVITGVEVLDNDPPALTRRGDAGRRAATLRESAVDGGGALRAEVSRRGAVTVDALRRSGLLVDGEDQLLAETTARELIHRGAWLISRDVLERWSHQLCDLISAVHHNDPLAPGLSLASVSSSLGLPSDELTAVVVEEAGVDSRAGYLALAGRGVDLTGIETSLAELEYRLGENPFAAPEARDLHAWGLGAKELAAAERAGRLLRLGDSVVLLPSGPALAMRELARLRQPFTTSDARQALGTTRRVAIPLLEYLDARGWTRRIDAGHREVVGGRG
ncbi:selenocysteine-specific translation elongation factor [Gordonia jinhuaensis]|uniref:Selenocysteine-specific elongation factor n=1 Tax=Gordonia jinhuaensis TaxID=1517702 RepID=A0A916WY56_9ACTN|nr:selenocysteine-specific translation elongation factor [Gordonia jinhuaensis]GGB38955.1 selenocysteine-specific translation elongation factor [Gordonia jinhuaensis]